MNLELILECLHELGDLELQRALWTGKLPGQQSSFVEAIEGLFTDSWLGLELERESTGLPAVLVDTLMEIRHLAREVDDSRDPTVIIDSELMSLIREKAVKAEALVRSYAAWN